MMCNSASPSLAFMLIELWSPSFLFMLIFLVFIQLVYDSRLVKEKNTFKGWLQNYCLHKYKRVYFPFLSDLTKQMSIVYCSNFASACNMQKNKKIICFRDITGVEPAQYIELLKKKIVVYSWKIADLIPPAAQVSLCQVSAPWDAKNGFTVSTNLGRYFMRRVLLTR